MLNGARLAAAPEPRRAPDGRSEWSAPRTRPTRGALWTKKVVRRALPELSGTAGGDPESQNHATLHPQNAPVAAGDPTASAWTCTGTAPTAAGCTTNGPARARHAIIASGRDRASFHQCNNASDWRPQELLHPRNDPLCPAPCASLTSRRLPGTLHRAQGLF